MSELKHTISDLSTAITELEEENSELRRKLELKNNELSRTREVKKHLEEQVETLLGDSNAMSWKDWKALAEQMQKEGESKTRMLERSLARETDLRKGVERVQAHALGEWQKLQEKKDPYDLGMSVVWAMVEQKLRAVLAAPRTPDKAEEIAADIEAFTGKKVDERARKLLKNACESPQKPLDKLVQKALNWWRYERNNKRVYINLENARLAEELQQAAEEYEAWKKEQEKVSCENCAHYGEKPNDELAPCGLPCTEFDLWEKKQGVTWADGTPVPESKTITSPVWLDDLCKALGWQGGTIHDAIAEVKRLKKESYDWQGNELSQQVQAIALALYQEYFSRLDDPVEAPDGFQYALMNEELWAKFCNTMSIYETTFMAEGDEAVEEKTYDPNKWARLAGLTPEQLEKRIALCMVGEHEAGIEIGDFHAPMAVCRHCRCYYNPRLQMRPPVEKKDEPKTTVIDNTHAGYGDGKGVPAGKPTSWLVWCRGYETDMTTVEAQGWYNARNEGELYFRRKYPDRDIGDIVIEGKEVENEAT